MSNKDIYRELCRKETDIPLFSQDWWLDAVCGEKNWDVAILENNNEIIASFPYFLKKQFVFKGIQLPPFTPQLGPWIKYPENQKYIDRLYFEEEIINKLIEKLPKFDYLTISINPSFTNWLPFYWQGFQQTTKYTYVIDDITNIETIVSDFSYAKKKNIKKASKEVEVKFDLSSQDFYDNHKRSLAQIGKKINYPYTILKNIYDEAYRNNAGKTIYAIDEKRNIHSALFIVWDKNSAYNLISTIDMDYKNSGATSLLIKEMINFLSDKTKKFDFEGSMIKNVENSFKQFGTQQLQYFKIMKFNSIPLKIIKALQS